MEIKMHKIIDITIKDVNNFQDAEDRVDQVLESLRSEIMEEVVDVLTKEGEE
jgi:hypothetical protein